MAAPSLYAHVPFCASRCSYCDFHSSARSASSLAAAADRWLDASLRHLGALASRFGERGFRTVYIGGGTPSWLPRDTLGGLLSAIGERASSGGREPEEWTVEANPEDADDGFLSLLLERGVDRLSLGVQSLQNAARLAAGRRGDAGAIERRLEAVSRRWPGRWSVDLMYGLPGQTARGLERDADYATGLGAGHVSLYELTLEEGTPLWRSVESGSVIAPGEDEKADMYEAAAGALRRAGLERYEVSNWARPGQGCLHNEAYWALSDWLAIGPSGVGNLGIGPGEFLRLENSADDDAYAADPAGSCSESTVSGKDAAFERLMTALRTARGLDLDDFSARFGIDPESAFGPLHDEFPELVSLVGRAWRPTDRGLDTLNIPLVSALERADAYYSSR